LFAAAVGPLTDRPGGRRFAAAAHGGLHIDAVVRPIARITMLPQRRISHAQGYLQLGMLAEAAAELDRITGGDAQSKEVLAVRLAVLHEQQDWPAARNLAGALVRRDPAEPALWITWAYATRRADSLDAAEKILLEAEILHPGDPTIHFNLGCYACQRGDLPLAKLRVDRAIAIDPKFLAIAAKDSDLEPLRAWQRQTDCQPGT
jgi:tetratricopeptide (TPR) repeat protein